MSLNILGRAAAARRDAKHICAVCKQPFDKPAIVLAMSLVDMPPDFPWHLFDGSSVAAVARLCERCSPIIETPQKLTDRLLKFAHGHWQVTVVFPDFRVRLLESVRDLPNPPINELKFFEGRSQPLAKQCKDAAGIMRYCSILEGHGIRVVGCFSGAEDIATVYHYGLLFAQEDFGEGPPYWYLDPRLLGPHRIAYLIMNEERTSYIGVVAFDTQGYSTLTWAWLHSAVRRKGVLSRIWPNLESSHPGFKVLSPISPGMQRFLAKHPGHELTEEIGGSDGR